MTVLLFIYFVFKYCTNVSLELHLRLKDGRQSGQKEALAMEQKRNYFRSFLFFFLFSITVCPFLELLENISCISLCGVLAHRQKQPKIVLHANIQNSII